MSPASMGPRLKDVEDGGSIKRTINRDRCFNGATSQGRGRPRPPASMRQSICRFNGATSQGRGRRARTPSGGSNGYCFNGATSQGRGRHLTLAQSRRPPRASMGPRLKDVEDLKAGANASDDFYKLQWGHVSRTWKTTPALGTPTAGVATLQWGHVSRTWKTMLMLASFSSFIMASMGPRLKDVEDI